VSTASVGAKVPGQEATSSASSIGSVSVTSAPKLDEVARDGPRGRLARLGDARAVGRAEQEDAGILQSLTPVREQPIDFPDDELRHPIVDGSRGPDQREVVVDLLGEEVRVHRDAVAADARPGRECRRTAGCSRRRWRQ